MWIWAALICYNTECLPPVAKIDPPPARVECPKQFRAKNYAKSNGGAESWSVVCAQSGSLVYGGLSFYAGEGITGTGGLLRLDRATKKLDVRRPTLLKDVSINSIAADGDVVWFGTTFNGECVGQPFVHGLVRYDWKSGEIKMWESSNDGPIGFVINAIALRDHSLWVETDLGLSRLDFDTNAWHHFDSKRRERTVKQIIEPLLRTVPRECLLSESFENQLIEGLARFRPRLLISYLNSAPAAERARDAPIAVYALEQSTGKRMLPNGAATRIERQQRFDFHRTWRQWSAADREAVVAAWSKLILPRHER